MSKGPSHGDYMVFGVKFSVAMVLAGVALMLIIGIITAPFGIAILVFTCRWIANSWMRIKEKQYKAAEEQHNHRLVTESREDTELPWLI